MRLQSRLLAPGLLVIFSLVSFGCRTSATSDDVAVLETNYGRIVIEFLPQEAPKNVANFIELTRDGFYDGTRFHRIVGKSGAKLVAIQGGDPNTISGDPSTWGQGQPGQKTVQGEFTKSVKHVRGMVSMARKQNDVNSATSQFFICVAPEPQWDGQYSIFGRVIDGMNIVDSIAHGPVWPNTDKPMDPVTITKATIQKRAELK
jgi:peptidyl-prolyl cis-trans isomerase B (cyclophilin B)